MERAQLNKVLKSTGCAEARGGHVFLCDPKWGARERDQFKKLAAAADKTPPPKTGWLCLSTGGTSGRLRFARHDEHTLSAAARGFCEHYGLKRVNAVDVLPPFHVSGFMSRARCAETGGTHMPWTWEDLKAGKFPKLPRRADGWMLSLVPTQLHRLLSGGERALIWLHQFKIIFLGGAPLWDALAVAAANARLPVVLSYGMTETAAMVAAQMPADFVAGRRDSGRPMPHARIEIIDDAAKKNTPARDGEPGLVRIAGASLFRGYFGEDAGETETAPDANPDGANQCGANSRGENSRGEKFFQTEDLAYWDERGGLNIVGRRDAVIITGGKKVYPAEVETLLRSSGVFADIAVLGAPDPKWGQSVIACYPGKPGGRFDKARVESALRPLASYKWPKRYVPVADWPRNPQGKLSRAALLAHAQA